MDNCRTFCAFSKLSVSLNFLFFYFFLSFSFSTKSFYNRHFRFLLGYGFLVSAVPFVDNYRTFSRFHIFSILCNILFFLLFQSLLFIYIYHGQLPYLSRTTTVPKIVQSLYLCGFKSAVIKGIKKSYLYPHKLYFYIALWVRFARLSRTFGGQLPYLFPFSQNSCLLQLSILLSLCIHFV